MKKMMEIRAIVRPSRLPQLRDALREIPNFPGLTMMKAEGFTAPASIDKRTVKEELIDYTPKIMVAVLADEDMVEEIRKTIIGACSTGQIGDGLVWTVPIATMHRVRNGSDMLAE
ncbi:MAG: P-II family nitrogen regulator [Hylemonella sp.]|jgi:nitrogen regulatory protein P-II 1|uniref:P-II family nitrogen regulator n=1 Tax=Hylemonella sp. TaxID=2066020 RepID=UPI00391D0C9E